MFAAEIAQPQTIAHRLASGGMPASDALRYAMLLAEALRRTHDKGRVYGALSPAAVALTESGLELLPAPPLTSADTPYTAPEVAAGGQPTVQSDVFSFGAVACEMLTGRPALAGDSLEALATSILGANPQPAGVASAHRLLGGCLQKDPSERLQHMQKVVLELRVLVVASRCSQADAWRSRKAADALLRSEIHDVESRITASLREQAALVLEMRESAGDRLDWFDQQLRTANASLAGVQALVEQAAESSGLRVLARAQEAIDRICDQWAQSAQETRAEIARIAEAAASLGDRVDRAEQGFEAEKQSAAGLRDLVVESVGASEKDLKAQAAQIESTRVALRQTDGLVEGVVEALEALQVAMLEQYHEGPLGVG